MAPFRDTLLHEPRGGRRGWFAVGGGSLIALASLAGAIGLLSPDVRWTAFLVLGLSFVAMGAAERLHPSRTTVAAALRIGSLSGFVVYAATWLDVAS